MPPTPTPARPPGQFALLRERRFGPFFWVQFLGAANDNVFKFAFTVLVTYQLQVAWLPPALAGLVIGAVFILPFLLFSATAGQLADKLDKAWLTRAVKNLELAIVALGAWGFVAPQVSVLLGCIFLLGLHSTLFGPVKYAYLPQHLSERELTGGNGLVEMGTFVAILLGNVAGGLLIALPAGGVLGATGAVAAACLLLAALGRLAAQAVPASPSSEPQLRIDWNPLRETWANLRLAAADPVVLRTLLGISWMWFFGAVLLSQFPAFAKEVLHGDAQVASLLLVVFSAGIGIGSLLCERLSHRHVEIGLVACGALGMSLFAAELWLACRALPPAPAGAPLRTVAEFAAQPAHWRVMADLFALSLSAGVFSVPMYALVQLRSPASHRARIIAANNILNALYMIASSLIVGALLAAGFGIAQVFGLLALANALVVAHLLWRVPAYLLCFAALLLSRGGYRQRLQGAERLPARGPALVRCGTLPAREALLLVAASPRPLRMVVDAQALQRPLLGALLRRAGAMALGGAPDGPAAAVLAQAGRVLDEGGVLAVATDDAALERWLQARLQRSALPVLRLGLAPAGAQAADVAAS